ncbi:hypothetical protein Tco_0272991 [Tanacetum coccineum]
MFDLRTCQLSTVHSRKRPLHLKDLHHHRSMSKKNAQERAIVSRKGRNAWWYKSVEELLLEKYPDKASGYVKGTDTMDV